MKKILFLHIPKTGGQTLLHIFSHRYEPTLYWRTREESLKLWRCWVNPEVSKPEVSFVFFDGERKEANLKALGKLPPYLKSSLYGVYGHFSFGIHRLLPGAWTYVTLLRHPVDRIISHYCFCRAQPGHALHDEIRRKKLTLADYIRYPPSGELVNGQAAMLAGVEDPRSIPEKELVNRAMKTLRRKDVVFGITEAFDTSVLYFARKLGWKHLSYYRPRNVRPEEYSGMQIDAKTRRLIEARNRADLSVYKKAKGLFLGKIIAQGVSFFCDRRRFRKMKQQVNARLIAAFPESEKQKPFMVSKP